MQKTILITGSTDGIGLVTAEKLAELGHRVLLHGRNPAKLKAAEERVSRHSSQNLVSGYVADLSQIDEVDSLASSISAEIDALDVIINNAGVFKTSQPITADGHDVRFVVNTLAPYRLTQRLMPLLTGEARVVNLSSAAQSPVDLDALAGRSRIAEDFTAYAQSKLALTMWTTQMAKTAAPMIVSVNPGSLLGSKMVKDAFGVDGGDLNIGADILVRAALSDEFANASGQYFDNDSGSFAPPHPDAGDMQKCAAVVAAVESTLAEMASPA